LGNRDLAPTRFKHAILKNPPNNTVGAKKVQYKEEKGSLKKREN